MNQAKEGESLQNQVDDAAQKVELLLGEVEFNQSAAAILKQIGKLRQLLRQGQEAVDSENFGEAADLLIAAENELNAIPAHQITKVFGLFVASITEVRHDLVEKLTKYWKAFFHTDFTRTTFAVKHQVQSK